MAGGADGTDRPTVIALMVAAQKPGQLALDLHAMRFVDLWIVGPVRGIENNAASILAQIFERGLFIVDQSNDDLAVPRAFGALHQGEIAIENTRLEHGIA